MDYMQDYGRTMTTGARASGSWLDTVFSGLEHSRPRHAGIQLLRQDYAKFELGRSSIGTPLRLGDQQFSHGLGTHSVSIIRVYSPQPIESFSASVGVDNNADTLGKHGSVVFVVTADDRETYRSGLLRSGEKPRRVELRLDGVHTLDLTVEDGGDGPSFDQADWAEAAIVVGGRRMLLDEMPLAEAPEGAGYPFLFSYDDKSSDELLQAWKPKVEKRKIGSDRAKTVTTWTDAATGLEVRWELIRYSDFPAAEWVLYFTNVGGVDTGIISDIRSLRAQLVSPMLGSVPYRLHGTKGGTPTPDQFEPVVTDIAPDSSAVLRAGDFGLSSDVNLPFFKLESSGRAIVGAIGWSGQWKATFTNSRSNLLTMAAGLELSHFRLHPGEEVRTPRILLLDWGGDTLEANAQFRQLIYKHYVPQRSGAKPLPLLFCNSAFTRGGSGMLNDSTAENQMSLIHAYGPLGLEAFMTDAGWFEGGYSDKSLSGAGTWKARKDNYPDGIAPVAAAAGEHGMLYGLWFLPEYGVGSNDSQIVRDHPDWVLKSPNGFAGLPILNLGVPEAREHYYNCVAQYMRLPGFGFYRQDSITLLPYFRENEAADRQGITEIKHITGLYDVLDRFASSWPGSVRENCASGGRRIDLETISRTHLTQKSDYWFHDEVDQASLWALSQFLPNCCFEGQLNRTDDYSFYSELPAALCLGWVTDAPDFDLKRAKELVDRYKSVRRLLVGAWYPLTPYSRDLDRWIASQYHRRDLDEGMVLAFRRPESPYPTLEVSLKGLEAQASYDLTFTSNGERRRISGAELANGLSLTLPKKRSAEMIVYTKVDASHSERAQ